MCRSLLVLLAVVLSACQGPPTQISIETSTPLSNFTSIPIPTNTLAPSPTVAPATPTSTPGPLEHLMVTVATKNYEMFSDTAIALANSDGTGFEIPALFEPFRYTGGVSGKHLVWSPHGRLLAFDGADTVDACGMPDTDCTTHNYGMFVLDYAEGRVIGYVESTLTNPSWSPDGQKLVLSVDAKQSNGGKSGNGDLYILDVNNGQKTRVTADKTSDSYPSWSPDGRQLAFVSDRDGNDEIFLMDLDGKGVVNLSQNPAMDDLPVWSPSGSHIAFTSSRGGLWKPYIMNADGTNQTLVDGDYLDVTGQPSWLPSPP